MDRTGAYTSSAEFPSSEALETDNLTDGCETDVSSLARSVWDVLDLLGTGKPPPYFGYRASLRLRQHASSNLGARMLIQLARNDPDPRRALFVSDVLRKSGHAAGVRFIADEALKAATKRGQVDRLTSALAGPSLEWVPSARRCVLNLQLDANGIVAFGRDSDKGERINENEVASDCGEWLKAVLSRLEASGPGLHRDVVIARVSRKYDRPSLRLLRELSRILPITVVFIWESADLFSGRARPNETDRFPVSCINMVGSGLAGSSVDSNRFTSVVGGELYSEKTYSRESLPCLAISYSGLQLYLAQALGWQRTELLEALREEAPDILPLGSNIGAFQWALAAISGENVYKSAQFISADLLRVGFFAEALRLLDEVPVSQRNKYHKSRWLKAAFGAGELKLASTWIAEGGESRRDRVIASESRAAADMIERLDSLESQGKLAATEYERVEGRVLSVLHASAPHQSGGYAVRAHNLLRAMVRSGWDVIAYTRPGFPELSNVLGAGEISRYHHDGVDYVMVGSQRRRKHAEYAYMRESIKYYREAIRRERPSVVHLRSTYVSALPALIAAKEFGLPTIYEVSGMWELVYAGANTPRLEGRRARTVTLENIVLSNADRVVTITDAMKELISSRVAVKAPIAVVPNAVASGEFTRKHEDSVLPEQFGWPPDVPIIGYVGSFVEYEGLDLLIRALAELRDRGTEFRALLIGDGVEYTRIRMLAQSLSLGNIVRFTGRVSHPEISRMYGVIDICPFPRRRTPATTAVSPLKPFEAMAAGKVVLVSRVPALEEIVGNGIRGIVFEEGSVSSIVEALAEAISNPEASSELSKRGRIWVHAERDWSVVGHLFSEHVSALSG